MGGDRLPWHLPGDGSSFLGVKAAVYYSIFFYVCWHCLAEDGGGDMKTVNLVQNNSINCFKLSKTLLSPHLLTSSSLTLFPRTSLAA